jgi:hypothetical protein
MVRRPTYDAGDPDAVRAKKTARELCLEQEQADLAAVMATPEGQRVIWRILERSGIHRTSFDPNALKMAFFEGRRDTGLWLEAEIARHCQHRYLEMQQLASTSTKEDTNA